MPKEKGVAEILGPYLNEPLVFEGKECRINEWDIDAGNNVIFTIEYADKTAQVKTFARQALEKWAEANLDFAPEPEEQEAMPTKSVTLKVETSVEKSITNMKEILYDVVVALKAKKIDTNTAITIAKVSQTWLNATRMEIDVNKLLK